MIPLVSLLRTRGNRWIFKPCVLCKTSPLDCGGGYLSNALAVHGKDFAGRRLENTIQNVDPFDL